MAEAKPSRTELRQHLERLERENRELRQALGAARRSDDAVLRFLDTPAIAITYMLRDGTILMVNRTGALNMGGEPADFVGKRIFDIFPHHAERTRKRIEQALDRGEPLLAENPIDLPSGRRWFRSTYHPVAAAGSEGEMVQLISQDITELKHMQELLKTTEGQLTSVLDHAPFYIALVEPQGMVRYVNRVPDGYVLEDVVGSQATEQLPPEYAALFERGLAKVRETLTPQSLAIDDLFGHQLEMHMAPIVRDGELAQLVVFLADVSERRAADKREQELQMQVLRAQKMESLGVLAGGIAHDFNNLLVGILGNAQLALQRTGKPAEQSHLEGIVNAAQRAAGLCRQMLAYAGREALQMEPIDVSELSTDMLALVRASMSKRARLVTECPQDLPRIEGDGTQLRQVVMNLLTNASDALGGGDGVITLRCGSSPRGADPALSPLGETCRSGEHVFIEVVDTGCGMDQEARSRMFEPFFTSKQLGSGLGLAAALGIIRAHHGSIEVESAPGRGTRVRVLLPAADGLRGEASKERSSSTTAQRGRILLVEDEEIVRAVTEQVLRRAGHEVLVAKDGAEAIATYDANPGAVDVVLMDLSMPRMDGREASRELRKRDAHLPIILSSGFALDARSSSDDDACPYTFFVAKPYEMDTLLSMVSRALARDS